MLAVLVALVLTSSAYATSRATEEIAHDSRVLQRADQVMVATWTTRNLLIQANLLVDAAKSQLVDQSLVLSAIGEANQSLSSLNAGVESLAAEWPAGAPALEVERHAVATATSSALSSLEAGDTTAAAASVDEAQASFERLAQLAELERDRRAAAIVSAGDRAGRVAVATRWMIALFLPCIAFLILHMHDRRESRQKLLESQLAQEKRVRRMKDDFLAAVVHHLRTPLTAVVGYAELLRDGRHRFNTGQRNEMIETLADEAADLGELIEDIHIAARSNSDTITVTPETCDVRRIAEAVAVGLGPSHREHLAIRGQGLANADPLRLRQILRNLTDNALKHHKTTAEVVIEAEGNRLYIEVIDDGPGIDPAVAEQVFSNHTSSVDSAPETLAIGVGLSLCRRLAAAMGAALTYERIDGRTVLSLNLPVAVRTVGSDEVDADQITTLDVVRAIEEEPPRIALQPIFDLATFYTEEPRLVGVEALSRFHKGNPTEWFDAAGEAGLRIDLELAAIKVAVQQTMNLGGADFFLALNVSTETLLSKSLLDAVAGLPPERVVFELSEDAAVSNYEITRGIVGGLQALGYRLALDDVGSGEMDLWHVVRLQPSIIKLDLSLTKNLTPGSDAFALVLGLTVFAAGINAEVIAEGIETNQELDEIRGIGITWGQGYLLGRPHVPDSPEYDYYEYLAAQTGSGRFSASA
ncbi:MAG TPA: EAL domain-containing protein [Acidimicrobiia bacterium]|nr:EAL domain-containing protein [Acidimicrobiia bacterium]